MNDLYIPKEIGVNKVESIIVNWFFGRGNLKSIVYGALLVLDYLSRKLLARQDWEGGVKLHHKTLRKMINHRHAS